MLTFKERQLDDGVLLLRLEGGLDHYTSPDLFACLEHEIANGRQRIIVDCGGLSMIASQGLAALVRAHMRMRKHGGDVKLADPPSRIANVLRLTMLDKVFAVYPDVATAHAAFDKSGDE